MTKQRQQLNDIIISAADALPVVTMVVDCDNRIIYANNAAEEMLGVSAQRLYGKFITSSAEGAQKLHAEGAQKLHADSIALLELFGDGNQLIKALAEARRYRTSRQVELLQARVWMSVLDDGVRVVLNLFPKFVAAGDLQPVTLPSGLSLGTSPEGGHSRLSVSGKAEQTAASRSLRSIDGLREILLHELRNPLAGIRGAAQLLIKARGQTQGDLTEESAIEQLAPMIQSEAERMVRLLDRLDSFDAALTVSVQPHNIHQIADHVVELVRSEYSASGNVVIVKNYDPSLPLVSCDYDALVQVLLNILRNAGYWSQLGGGRVQMVTRFVRRRISTSASLAGDVPPHHNSNCVELAIIDDGPGISESIFPNLFEPFVSARVGGLGLGLALANQLMTSMGGSISCNSARGRCEFALQFASA